MSDGTESGREDEALRGNDRAFADLCRPFLRSPDVIAVALLDASGSLLQRLGDAKVFGDAGGRAESLYLTAVGSERALCVVFDAAIDVDEIRALVEPATDAIRARFSAD